jgi:hypothetical protein
MVCVYVCVLLSFAHSIATTVMAYSSRRSMLSTHDNNVPIISNSNPPISGMKTSKGMSRQSMIPRQSMAPPRVTSGQEALSNAPLRSSVGPRSSMAIGMNHPVLSSSTMTDVDGAGPSTVSTPHRAPMPTTRKAESGGRMSVAQTPK